MDAISRFIDCDDWGVSLHFSTHMLSGAPILFMGLQILTTLSRPVSIRAIGMLIAKESMPLVKTGFGRIIG